MAIEINDTQAIERSSGDQQNQALNAAFMEDILPKHGKGAEESASDQKSAQQKTDSLSFQVAAQRTCVYSYPYGDPNYGSSYTFPC